MPEYATFYFLSAQLDENLSDVPLPWDPYNGRLPVYALDPTNNVYLIADAPEDYIGLSAQSSSATFSVEDERVIALDEEGGSDFVSESFSADDLWLELAALTNGAVSLIAHPPAVQAADSVYDLYSTTDLSANWQWVLRTDPGQTKPSGYESAGGPMLLHPGPDKRYGRGRIERCL